MIDSSLPPPVMDPVLLIPPHGGLEGRVIRVVDGRVVDVEPMLPTDVADVVVWGDPVPEEGGEIHFEVPLFRDASHLVFEEDRVASIELGDSMSPCDHVHVSEDPPLAPAIPVFAIPVPGSAAGRVPTAIHGNPSGSFGGASSSG